MKDITELIQTWSNPWEKYGVEDNDFVSIEDLVGKTIEIEDAKLFTNDSGEGAYILFKTQDGERYTCTHSIGLCAPFKDEAVMDALPLMAKIVKRKSKTSDHTVYAYGPADKA